MVRVMGGCRVRYIFGFVAIVVVQVLLGGSAFAGGLDRSGQPVDFLFKQGNYTEIGVAGVSQTISGNDLVIYGGQDTGNVGSDYLQVDASIKTDYTDQLSFGLIYDQPFGSDIEYAQSSIMFGGTLAETESHALTGLVRYKFGKGFSLHGGLRLQRVNGTVALLGQAYGSIDGYKVNFSKDYAMGFLAGGAYEKPELGLRFSFTYNSKIEHEMDTVETISEAIIGTTPTETDSPQSINVDLQVGLMQDLLLMGGFRWVEWDEFLLEPEMLYALTGSGLVDLDNTTTYYLGLGKRFNSAWSSALYLVYEEEGDELVSPLSPTTGLIGPLVATTYTINSTTITGWFKYYQLGDAKPETGTPDEARAEFVDNYLLGAGVRVGWSF